MAPTALEQMQAFHAEDRLADHSLVARAGEEQFHPASEDPELAAPLASRPSAATQPDQCSPPASPAQPHRFGARDRAGNRASAARPIL